MLDAAGEPVEGAWIWVSDYGNLTFRRRACCTDAAGEITVPAARPGHRVLAQAERGRPSRALYLPAGFGTAGRVELTLGAGLPASLSCELVLPGGQPAAGAQLSLLPSGPAAGRRVPLLCATADGAGRVELAGLWPGPCLLEAVAPGRGGARREVVLSAGARTTERIQLGGGSELRGLVVDERGAPAPGAELRLRQEARTIEIVEGTTAADGSFAFDGLLPVSTGISARHAELGASAETVDLAAGPAPPLRIVLSPRLDLRGWVRRPDGEPAAGWHVSVPVEGQRGVWTHAATTDAAGAFALQRLLGGPVRLDLRPPPGGFAPVADRHVVEAGTLDAVLVVDPGGLPSAFVTARLAMADGLALGSGVASLKPPDEIVGYELSVAAESAELAAGPLVPGVYELALQLRGAVRYRAAVELAPGQRLDLGTLVLSPSGELLCRAEGLRDDDGRARIVLIRLDREELWLIASPELGEARFDHLDPGDYAVELHVDGERVARERTAVRARESSRVLLRRP
ncbi:MAG: carboxypeptidase-like regulatory domain-containing protein [Planctomycetota bacterium]